MEATRRLIDAAPEWARIDAQDWGPISAWKYVLGELGLLRARDGALRWSRKPGAQFAPRRGQ
eukprot:3306709-Alexandrium_andersonii.AAC.1